MLPQHLDVVPQPMGEFQPLDRWQGHVNELFHALRGHQAQDFLQTFAAADYRLAHALAAEYVEQVKARSRNEASAGRDRPLIIHEWGCGHGNLAACFLNHVKALDKDGEIYPRVLYVLVDVREEALVTALAHPDLAVHRDRVQTLCASATSLASVPAGSVDRILCNELWTELPTKLVAKNKGEVEEEHVRPNLSEARHAQIEDWSGFLRAFAKKDLARLASESTFFEELIWEREYHNVDWKDVPYRKTIMEFLKPFDDEVLIPVNLGAFETVKEARRLMASDAIGFSSFDAGAATFETLSTPEKPCSAQIGGLYSVMVNFLLIGTVAKHLGAKELQIEPQREFIGRNLGANVMILTDILASHPELGRLTKWQQDRLVVQTLRALNQHYRSPYARTIQFPLSADMPESERATLESQLVELSPHGVPNTAAYLTEDEVMAALPDLEALEYDREGILMALHAPPAAIDYVHWNCRS